MIGDPDKGDTESLKEKIEAAATLPDNIRIVYWLLENIEIRVKGTPFVRILCICRQEYATIVRQLERNVQVQIGPE